MIDRGHKKSSSQAIYINPPAKYNGRKMSAVASAVRFMVVCTCVNSLGVCASGRSQLGWENQLFQQKEFHRESPYTTQPLPESHLCLDQSGPMTVEPDCVVRGQSSTHRQTQSHSHIVSLNTWWKCACRPMSRVSVCNTTLFSISRSHSYMCAV